MSRSTLYDSQKFGENIDRRYGTVIEIKQTIFEDDKKKVVVAFDGNTYTHWKNDKYKGFADELKDGAEVSVYVNQKRNMKGDKPWKNITPSIF